MLFQVVVGQKLEQRKCKEGTLETQERLALWGNFICGCKAAEACDGERVKNLVR